MILGLQVIAIIFALLMIYFPYLHYRRGELNGMEIFFWICLWIGAIFIVLFPQLFATFSRTIAISRAFDLAVLGGFILSIPMIYSAYIKTKRLEKKIENFIRNEALKDLDSGKKHKKAS